MQSRLFAFALEAIVMMLQILDIVKCCYFVFAKDKNMFYILGLGEGGSCHFTKVKLQGNIYVLKILNPERSTR